MGDKPRRAEHQAPPVHRRRWAAAGALGHPWPAPTSHPAAGAVGRRSGQRQPAGLTAWEGRPRKRPGKLVGDKGYCVGRARRLVRRRGIAAVISTKSRSAASLASTGPPIEAGTRSSATLAGLSSPPRGHQVRQAGLQLPGLGHPGRCRDLATTLCGKALLRVFAIDLVPELVRTGRAHEEVERSRPETVALSDRLQPAYQKVLERNPGGGVGSGQRCS